MDLTPEENMQMYLARYADELHVLIQRFFSLDAAKQLVIISNFIDA